MKKISVFISAILVSCMLQGQDQSDFVPLKKLFGDDFLIGVAVNERCFTGDAAKLVVENFNTITAENAMKPANVLFSRPQRPQGAPQGQSPQAQNRPQRIPQAPLKLDTVNGLVFNWASADRHAEFARENNLKVRGHTLVWHSQTPASFFTDDQGNQLSKEQLYARMKDYMTVVMNRYKDIIFCWDVVNEALSDNDGEIYRTASKWYEICGKDYIAQAFRTARSINPDVKLIYNDYNIVNPAKLERCYTMLKELKDAGVPVDGVGLQAHWSNDVTGEMIRKAIDKLSSLGLEIQITELDLTTYTNYHGEGGKNQVQETHQFTEELQQLQADKYKSYFEALHEKADKVTSVTFWGLDDGKTWLNGFPVRGRRDYPLLFDAELKPKKAYYSIKSIYQK